MKYLHVTLPSKEDSPPPKKKQMTQLFSWRIIPVSKWLVTPFISPFGHLEEEQPYWGLLTTY